MELRRALTAVLLLGCPLGAHHTTYDDFDVTRPLKLLGTIRNVRFINPHVLIEVAARQPDGSDKAWQVQLPAPGFLIRGGITRSNLIQGATVAVDVFPAKDGSPYADTNAGGTISLGSGEKADLPGRAPPRNPSAHGAK